MKKTLLLLLVSSPFLNSHSSEILGVSVTAKNELSLTASSCELLIKQRDSLCAWKKTLDPDFTAPSYLKNTCTPEAKKKFRLNISECLPDFAKNYQRKKLFHEGPNCWGTAMSFKALSDYPRFMWPEEMEYWMHSPVCRKLSPNEEKLPGDIINVYAPEKLDESDLNVKDEGALFWETLYPERFTAPEAAGYTGFHRLLHSVTYVSPDLAFGKDSPAHDDRFYFHAMEEVYGRPRASDPRDIECQENQTMTPHMREYHKPPQKISGSKCSYFSQVYRCQNLTEFLAKEAVSSEARDILARVETLKAIQKKLFPQLLTSQKLIPQKEVDAMVALSELSLKRATNGLKQKNLDKAHERLYVMEFFSAAGIKQTLKQFRLIK